LGVLRKQGVPKSREGGCRSLSSSILILFRRIDGSRRRRRRSRNLDPVVSDYLVCNPPTV
jgi:hypothetical protein